jgi:hypothetical protein
MNRINEINNKINKINNKMNNLKNTLQIRNLNFKFK